MWTKRQLGAAQGVYYCVSRQKICILTGNTFTAVKREALNLTKKVCSFFDPNNQESGRS